MRAIAELNCVDKSHWSYPRQLRRHSYHPPAQRPSRPRQRHQRSLPWLKVKASAVTSR
jgi:hypothetical protein